MLAAPSRKRVRSKGRWSGADAKHIFLLSCLCDEELATRLEALRGTSAWWPWLNAQPGAEGDTLTYLCPTYVLYDALSDAGRGEWGVVNCAFRIHLRILLYDAAAMPAFSFIIWFSASLVQTHFCDTVNADTCRGPPLVLLIHSLAHLFIPLNADDLESAYQKPTALKVSGQRGRGRVPGSST